MGLLCAIGWHRPDAKVIPNEGRMFSRCKSCDADLVLVGSRWKLAPQGYKVVWRAPQPPVVEVPPEPEPDPAKRRKRERRVNRRGDLPAKLGGRDRRKARDRRHGFGKRPDVTDG